MELSFTLLCKNGLVERQYGNMLLKLLALWLPNHVPERYGTEEPLSNEFIAADREVPAVWGTDRSFLMARRQPRMLLTVNFSPHRHSSISMLEFETSSSADVAAIEQFAYRATEAFEAEYGVLHILTRAELEDRLSLKRQRSVVIDSAKLARFPPAMQDILRRSSTREAREQSYERMRERIEREGFASVLWEMTVCRNVSLQLQNCIPDLYWISIFGSPYIEVFGREKLKNAPVARLSELANGAVAMKLTDCIQDDLTSYQKFAAIRERCKEYLGSVAFCAEAA